MSRKVTVPTVRGVDVPVVTAAVMVNTDPLAAVKGVIESVVEVVCAPARGADIATKKATERAPRGFFRRNVSPRDVA